MSNKLKAITAKAKQLYKSGRYSKWTDAIKAASKQVAKPAKKKVSGVKKKAAKKVARKPAKKYASSHSDKNSHNVKIHVVSGLDANAYKVRSLCETDLVRFQRSKEAIKKSTTLTKREKSQHLNKLAKQINSTKKTLRAVNLQISNALR